MTADFIILIYSIESKELDLTDRIFRTGFPAAEDLPSSNDL